MICLLFVPASIQIIHAFETHEHIICTSEDEQHFHVDDMECILCHLQAETHGIIQKSDYETLTRSNFIEEVNFYNFYHNHQHLSYSLRAPPIF